MNEIRDEDIRSDSRSLLGLNSIGCQLVWLFFFQNYFLSRDIDDKNSCVIVRFIDKKYSPQHEISRNSYFHQEIIRWFHIE